MTCATGPAPNIRPAVEPHSTCWIQYIGEHPRLGDVRRCPHGKVQVLSEVGINAPRQGPGTNWWRTLSPILDFKTYRRATAALGGNK